MVLGALAGIAVARDIISNDAPCQRSPKMLRSRVDWSVRDASINERGFKKRYGVSMGILKSSLRLTHPITWWMTS